MLVENECVQHSDSTVINVMVGLEMNPTVGEWGCIPKVFWQSYILAVRISTGQNIHADLQWFILVYKNPITTFGNSEFSLMMY